MSAIQKFKLHEWFVPPIMVPGLLRLVSGITESREVLNLSELVREPSPPAFQQLC
jgi:hypothetical protein